MEIIRKTIPITISDTGKASVHHLKNIYCRTEMAKGLNHADQYLFDVRCNFRKLYEYILLITNTEGLYRIRSNITETAGQAHVPDSDLRK